MHIHTRVNTRKHVHTETTQSYTHGSTDTGTNTSLLLFSNISISPRGYIKSNSIGLDCDIVMKPELWADERWRRPGWEKTGGPS